MEMDQEEAYVETGEDPYHAEPPQFREAPEQPQNLFLSTLLHYLSNPWILIIVALLSYFYVFKRVWPMIVDRWTDFNLRRQQDRDLAEMVRNPDLYRQKMEAMDQVRVRQQERYEEAARAMAEREREKEEEKRRQRLEELENLASGKGYRNKTGLRGQANGQNEAAGSDNKIKKKPVLRPEYNPLMGDSGSSSGSNFRRRGLGGAGGGGG